VSAVVCLRCRHLCSPQTQAQANSAPTLPTRKESDWPHTCILCCQALNKHCEGDMSRAALIQATDWSIIGTPGPILCGHRLLFLHHVSRVRCQHYSFGAPVPTWASRLHLLLCCGQCVAGDNRLYAAVGLSRNSCAAERRVLLVCLPSGMAL
jgi:hypothetical protein